MWFTAPSTLLNSVGRRALNILKAGVLRERGEEKEKSSGHVVTKCHPHIFQSLLKDDILTRHLQRKDRI